MVIRLPGKPQSWLDKEIAKAEEEQFSIELDEARKSGRYQIHVAARLIVQAAGYFVSSAKMEERLLIAVHDKSLPAYNMHQTIRWDGEMPFIALLDVYWDDLNTWIKENESRVDYKFPDPKTSTVVKNESIKGVTKQQIMSAFHKMHFDSTQWSKYLSSPPIWLINCRVLKGVKGNNQVSSLWNPVKIARALHTDHDISLEKLDTIFRKPILKDWADEWDDESDLLR